MVSMMFDRYLQALEAQHLLRRLRTIESSDATRITVDGRSLILMASNNYLGLANHPAVKQAATQAIAQWGVGSGASRLISGTAKPHQELEEQLAHFKQTKSALVFGSGYATNVGVIPALAEKEGLILADRLCHASLIDGCRLAKAELRVFHHNDTSHLQKLLEKRSARRPTLIVTEGVFSMDGDLAPLSALHHLAQSYEASLLVDDAHGTGVLGASGRGTLEHFGIQAHSCFQMGTLSKAIGTSGGYVVGTNAFIQYVINTARSFMYTTAPPPAIMAAASAAISLIQAEPERRSRLWKNRERMYTGLKAMGFSFTETQSPILPILVQDPEKALAMSESLSRAGVYVPAIRPPTVPKGSSRLRLTVTSEHTEEHLESVIKACKKVGEDLRLI